MKKLKAQRVVVSVLVDVGSSVDAEGEASSVMGVSSQWGRDVRSEHRERVLASGETRDGGDGAQALQL
jgi:hypothetical protein